METRCNAISEHSTRQQEQPGDLNTTQLMQNEAVQLENTLSLQVHTVQLLPQNFVPAEGGG